MLDWKLRKGAIDEDTGNPVNGTNHTPPNAIGVAAGHYYYVWVDRPGYIYTVKNYPKDWIVISAPEGDYEAAYGYAAGSSNYQVHFTTE